ncbi:MAG: fliF [Ramlibacter sp.]|uniref:flagellar basal-body MS-ring/collar protein FliF n=1 Tax=Ramlibacter sp. TaxID=1917967 RepID=UPI00262F2444|nr:flagellar basal-body MS-ring/collar protein FliF [Ramlibacter sp.]MDB5750677.1 fliF [Ramlibacter sp.]
MKIWWDALEQRSRLGLGAGATAVLVAVLLAGWWLLRGQQAVLFSDLKPQDAAVMAAELERQKVPYSVADGGSTLLVDQAQVHATRLKLMGKDLPLHGAVGLELFNNTDFGMTEFAQKINFQRALQGELTRTILSFAEIRDARVHLALPEQGLFKQAATRPKAGVTLTLRQGQSLRPEQVSGIQRLVAAAVAGLAAQEVTIVSHQGVALSRSGNEAEGDGAGRLELKRETEDYLSRKAGVVLERAFGPGQALASVDVTLNMDQVRVTTEDVIAAPEGKGGAATGVLVRERESARDSATPEADHRAARGSSMQRDVEYQTGRRVEQVVSQPGSIRRLHVVAVVRQALDGQQQEQVRKLVAAAVGASTERGDAVVVQSFATLPVDPLSRGQEPAVLAAAAPSTGADPVRNLPGQAVAVIALLASAGALAWAWRRQPRCAMPARLTETQRQAALQRVEAWLQVDDDGRLPAGGLVDAAGGRP